MHLLGVTQPLYRQQPYEHAQTNSSMPNNPREKGTPLTQHTQCQTPKDLL